MIYNVFDLARRGLARVKLSEPAGGEAVGYNSSSAVRMQPRRR